MINNVTFFTDEVGNEQVLIDNGDGNFVSMLKSVYDEQQAKADGAATI